MVFLFLIRNLFHPQRNRIHVACWTDACLPGRFDSSGASPRGCPTTRGELSRYRITEMTIAFHSDKNASLALRYLDGMKRKRTNASCSVRKYTFTSNNALPTYSIQSACRWLLLCSQIYILRGACSEADQTPFENERTERGGDERRGECADDGGSHACGTCMRGPERVVRRHVATKLLVELTAASTS